MDLLIIISIIQRNEECIIIKYLRGCVFFGVYADLAKNFARRFFCFSIIGLMISSSGTGFEVHGSRIENDGARLNVANRLAETLIGRSG